MLKALLKYGSPALVAVAVENHFVSSVENNKRLYGLVLLVNLVGASFNILGLGMKVGAARKKYNVELPAMYATGDSEDAKAFNCVQRGHQQALETFQIFLGLSLVSGVRFPVFTSLMGILYSLSRNEWARCYAEKGAEKRYESFLAKQVWTPLITLTAATIFFAVELLAGVQLKQQ